MRTLQIVALLIANLTFVRSAAGQGLPTLPVGGYYINCPTALNNIAWNYSLLPYSCGFSKF